MLAQDDASHTGLLVTAKIEPAVATSLTLSSAMANASATDASSMSAYVSGNAALTGTGGAVSIGSGAPVDVESTLTSVSVALGLAGNTASAIATTNTAFSSYVDSNLDSATTRVREVRRHHRRRPWDRDDQGRRHSRCVGGLLDAENHLSATATGDATMNAYVVDHALVEGDGGPGTPAVSIVSGSDVVVDAKARGRGQCGDVRHRR